MKKLKLTVLACAATLLGGLGSAELVTRESMQLSDVEASCKLAQPPSRVAAQASTVSLSFFMACKNTCSQEECRAIPG